MLKMNWFPIRGKTDTVIKSSASFIHCSLEIVLVKSNSKANVDVHTINMVAVPWNFSNASCNTLTLEVII